MHAKAMLKELLAYDIDRAVLLSDPVFAGSDTLATGYVLSKGIRCAGDYDLIFWRQTVNRWRHWSSGAFPCPKI